MVVPPMPSIGRTVGRARMANPLSIPFYGAYWIYRPPDTQPPPESVVIRGNPAERILRSTDRVRLKMEARQNLGTFLNTACCSRIDVIVMNGERYRGTVKVELLLGNTETKGKPPESLGTVPLPPRPAGRGVPPQTMATLTFPVHRSERFDEVVLVFHVDPMRAHEAARVAVERFVLVPR